MINLERNNTSFPIHITSRLKDLFNIYKNDNRWNSLLKYYQYIVKTVITDSEFSIKGSRGLLIYFTMGIGKTRTAASIALQVSNNVKVIKNTKNKTIIGGNVIVILPKSLQDNFKESMCFLEKHTSINNNRVKYISIDAYNASKQLYNLESELNGSIVIIDEAHNFFRAVVSGTHESNAYKIYEQLMNHDVKLVLMTGTPVSKNPFELVPCINLLAGSEILPTNYEHFNDLYIDKITKDIRNKDYLSNRLLGLVSYMTISDTAMFPTEFPTIISEVEMSEVQYSKYLHAREKEEYNKKNNISLKIESKSMLLPKQSNMSSYYIASRSLSNFVETDGEVSEINSPKMWLMSNRIAASTGLVLVYSQFVNQHGLKQISLFLQLHGFNEFILDEKINDEKINDEKINDEKINDEKINAVQSKKYVFFTGNVDPRVRNKILTIFNSDDNKYGQIIKVILVSKTGAEGLDLRNIRETHQMEPYWDLSRNKQVKARAIRYGSHLSLPENERTVQPYLYLSVANKKMKDSMKNKESKTIDQIFNERAVEQDKINTKFNDLLKEVSIECSYFGMAKCYVCNPTNERLFTSDPLTDSKIKNPCTPYEETEKEAIKIIIDDIEYYYTHDPFHVYKYDIILDGFIEFNDHPIIEKIKEKLAELT
jgi:hypothetical protein